MEWDKVLDNRKQTFVFDQEKIPTRKIIDQIIYEMHEKCPSKQKRVVYKLNIFDDNNVRQKLDLYSHTQRNPSSTLQRYNPQVIAPYLFVWSMRDKQEIDKNVSHIEDNNVLKVNDEYEDKEQLFIMANLEIGLSSMFVALSASNQGLSTGFCKCINHTDLIHKKYGFKPILMMGLGYASEDQKKYYCPINQKLIRTQDDKWLTKPELDQYVHFSV
jgi:hypothetical protein